MTESKLQSRISKELRNMGWIVNKPVTNSYNGWPDLHCYSDNGKTMFIEVKKGDEKPRPLQIYWIEELRRMGFPVYVISSIEEMNVMIRSLSEK